MTATVKSQTVGAKANASRFNIDRTTAYGIVVLVVGVLILSGLIALITYLPAQTIAQSISAQASENQRILAQSLARQAEDYFNSIAYDLLGLSNRPEIKATADTSRVAAMTLLADEAKQRTGQIKSIVRLSQDGSPLYAWPDSYNQNIQAGKALPWKVDQNWVVQIVQGRAVQYRQVPLTAGGATYLLVAPIDLATTNSEAIAIEVDLTTYFKTNFSSLQLSATSQLWIFDRFGAELFHYRESPIFKGDANKLPQQQDSVILPQFPTPDRETAVVPIYAAYSQGRGGERSFTLLLSHVTAEGQEAVTSTLRTLFLVGLAVVLVVMVAGGIVGLFLLRENNRRRQDAQRRSTARTLLTTSRALNSSLELKRVLDLILGELSTILPHDNASILLVDEEDKTFTVAAESGAESIGDGRTIIPFSTLRGAREVAITGKPVVINDTQTDPRWKVKQGSNIRSWLGVPLRVRDEAVGVLSIDSFTSERFMPDDVDFAEAFAGQAGVAIQNARNHEFQIKTYETELQTARLIQTSLLPQEHPPVAEIEMASRSIPARQVSGDYYQYYMLPDGRLGVAVGDVSGKGIPAALMMAVITTALREEIFRIPSPAPLLNELNARLVERMQQNNMNSALLMTIFDPHGRVVEVANGGMVQPYLRNGGGWDFVEVGGYPLGAAARSDYKAKTITMPTDSMLVMVSDGVVESMNRKSEMFGFERLEALLTDLPRECPSEQAADAIITAVHEHLDGQDPQDDITVVVMKSVKV